MRGSIYAARCMLTRPGPSGRLVRWTVFSTRRLTRDLSEDAGFAAVGRLTPPPASRGADRVIVSGTLRCLRATCLVRAAILQRWDAEHGHPRALHIGVRRVDGRVEAHAWLDGDPVDEGFSELHLHPAPTPAPAEARATR